MSKQVLNSPFDVSLVSFPDESSTTLYKELSSSFAALAIARRARMSESRLSQSKSPKKTELWSTKLL